MFSQWELIQFSVRWSLYLTLSGVIGGVGSLLLIRQSIPSLLPRIKKYVRLSSLLGAVLCFAYFWSQMGGILEAPLWQSYDQDMALFLLQSPTGLFFKYNLLGYFLIFTSMLTYRLSRPCLVLACSKIRSLLLPIGLFLLVFGYSKVGHSVSTNWFIRLALLIHIVVAAWWVGSLLSLLWVSKAEHTKQAKYVLECFGQLAMLPIVLLLIFGGLMAITYMGNNNWLSFHYGQALLVKVAFVIVLLFLALHHKHHRVPALMNATSIMGMRRSLMAEILIMLGVILMTTYLSTFIGPPSH